jgi:hypothetical protein
MLLCFMITAQSENKKNIYGAVLYEINVTGPYYINNNALYFNNCLIHCNWERACLLCAYYYNLFIKILCRPFYC